MPEVLEVTIVYNPERVDHYLLRGRSMPGKPSMVVEEPEGHVTLVFRQEEPIKTTQMELVSTLMEFCEQMKNAFDVVFSLMRAGVAYGRLRVPSAWLLPLFGVLGVKTPSADIVVNGDGFFFLCDGERVAVTPRSNAKVEPARLHHAMGLQPTGGFVLEVTESPTHIRAINEDGTVLCENLRTWDILHNGVRVDDLKEKLGLKGEPFDVLVHKHFNLVLGYRSDTAQLIFKKSEEALLASGVTPADLIQEASPAE